ncbi:MAG: putative DNA binding domain-containing protein [Victivallales bacterium]|nr:putative DNA binding domain-containing protein [Victivallales bacterium]
MKASAKYIKTVQSLLEYPREQEWFEFKANWYEPNALGEYVSALANAAAYHGHDFGYFVWGIEDKTHAIVGTDFDQMQEVKHEPLAHYLERQLAPDTAFAFHELELEGKRIVLMEISAAKTVPTAFANVRYFRIGSSKVVLAKYPERESELFQILRNGPPTLSNTEAPRQDLTFDKLIVYYASKGITLNRRTFKRNLGFLMPDGKYNLLAQLLSDNCGINIRFAMFNGKDKASTMYSVRELGNTCLLYSLDKALEIGDVLNIPQADERNRVVERKEVPLFNAEAYREAVVNAFVHNRWTDLNSPMFCAYSDRVEILSHGALPPKQTVKGFFEGVSVPVNPELSTIFLQLHISERTGRGVPKIINAYDKGIFEFGENTISVTIPYNRLEGKAQTPHVNTLVDTQVDAQVDAQVNAQVDAQVKHNETQVLLFCSTPKSMLELAQLLHVKDRRTVKRVILPLLEQGRLAMTIPQSPNSRFQKYITIK